MNKSFCNECSQIVPADHEKRGNQVFLIKTCPSCGTTETLISGDAKRFFAKRTFEKALEAGSCKMNCLSCRHGRSPANVFIDLTNRCNQNCPICINNTPSMGFTFDPPLAYFKRIFDHLAGLHPKPAVQFFGGEPTVREDLFQIVEMAQSRGLAVRIVTNGVRLADKEYCRKLMDYGLPLLFAYDGADPRTYEVLRGSANVIKAKHKALENLNQIPGAHVTLISMIAKGFNDQGVPALLDLCHRYSMIKALYFIPLAHTWNPEDFPYAADRITNEDVEEIVDGCFPEQRVEFQPAGAVGETKNLLTLLGVEPLPFASAHPNCESEYVLAQTEEGYLPISHFLKTSVSDALHSIRRIEKSIITRDARIESKRDLIIQRLLAAPALLSLVRNHLELDKCVNGRGLARIGHLLAMIGGYLTGKSLPEFIKGHSTLEEVLAVAVLPFEDSATLETERLEACPSAFGYYDSQADEVRFVPTCAWSHYKTECMRAISAHYNNEKEHKTESQTVMVSSANGYCSKALAQC